MMKAIVHDRYGPPEVLRFEDLDQPRIGSRQVLIRVMAAAPNPWDWHFMRGEPYLVRLMTGLRRPRKPTVMGSDMAGVVEAVGEEVAGFQPGDEVYGFVGFGGFAELAAIDAGVLASKPANLSFEEAAAVPLAALTALQGLRDHGRIQAGHEVLINGAAGGVGTLAVQIAGAMGAKVTGVCSTRNVEMVRAIGADHVIDYTSQEVLATDRRYDIVLDNVGNHDWSDWWTVMAPGGRLVPVAGRQPLSNWLVPVPHSLRLSWTSLFGRPVDGFTAKPNAADLHYLTELIEQGLVRPVIQRIYSLDAAAEAMADLEEGHVSGKLVVKI
jgi:NADPH:quinone reductase-like Zn-dependent oxidoreductase